MLWYDRRLIDGGTRLDFDSIRHTTLRPFGLLLHGSRPRRADRRGAARLLPARLRSGPARTWSRSAARSGRPSTRVRARTRARWREHFDRVQVDGGTPARRTVMATALYHSLIKPCFADDESPFWPDLRPVRVRHLHHVGHLQDPAPAARRDRPGPGGGPAGVAHPGVRGGGQLPDRVPDGPRRRPVLPAGQRARAHRTGRRPRAPAGRARLELGAGAHGRRPAPDVRRGLLRARRGAPDHAHPRPRVRAPLHRAGRPRVERPPAGRGPGPARPRAGSTPSTRPPDCCATRSSTRAASGTTRSGCCTTWPPGSRWPAGTRPSSACWTASSGTARAGDAARPAPGRGRDGAPGTR